jgi:CheY-like chemotaxis protein
MALRVLVVDDNRDLADSLSLLLRREGFEVKTTYSGQDAIDTALPFKPDVLIVDIVMPDVDGLRVASHLRTLPEFADKVFVALSGYSEQKYLDQASRAKFDEYLVKPFKRDTLISILTEAASQLGNS